ncbi:MAG TPA: c-type cytochrome [Acidimicrobiales bacterium]|nr:c-type cytochrome [Acidimicrobiales bacterium]
MRARSVRRLLVAVPVLVTAVATPLVLAASRPAGAQDPDGEQLARGADLYETGCSSCHGHDGRGVDAPDGSVRGPTLETTGEAGAYYYLTTGRMPMANSEEQPVRKPPAYREDQIADLVAYVGSISDGPAIPEVDADAGDLAQGGEVFRGNCQACHSASGSGGALSYGRAAPRLSDATPTQVGAAVRVGPGQMPVFGPETITARQLDSLASYVEYLRSPDDPGGVPIGRTGPIPEGFVAWLVGMPALVALVAWIGTRSPILPGRRHG